MARKATLGASIVAVFLLPTGKLCADPVTLAVSALVTAASSAVSAITFAQVALTVATTAIAAGASYLLRPNITAPSAARGAASAAPANSQRSVPVSQAIPPRRFAYGRVRTGGTLFFQDNSNPGLYIGTVLSDGEIESVEQVFFGEIPIPLDGSGDALSTSAYSGKFSMDWASGAPGQTASPLLIDGFPGALTSDFKQNGVARAVVRLDWGTDAQNHQVLWGSSISPSFYIRGVKVYDPRDVAQDLGDPTTWGYSDNPALVVAHALTNCWNTKLDTAALDWTSVGVAADVCDATISYQGEDVPIFRSAGIFQADVDLASQISELLTAFRGKITFSNGRYSLVADQARTSIWTVTDDDILELGEYQHSAETRACFNSISAVYYSTEETGKQTTTGTYELTAAIADEGLRETVVKLPFTPDNHSAQIIAYRELQHTRDGRALSLRLTDAAVYLVPGEIITIETEAATFLNGVYEVEQIDIADVGVAVTLRGYNPDVYADPATYLV